LRPSDGSGQDVGAAGWAQ